MLSIFFVQEHCLSLNSKYLNSIIQAVQQENGCSCGQRKPATSTHSTL